eukprot:scaffold92009_cov60-Cyclotella_meneghiniana.AAC.2
MSARMMMGSLPVSNSFTVTANAAPIVQPPNLLWGGIPSLPKKLLKNDTEEEPRTTTTRNQSTIMRERLLESVKAD